MNNENNIVPDYRFPEFSSNGNWEIKNLNEIAKITNGNANAQDHTENGLYPLFDRSAVIKSSNTYLFDGEAVIIPGEGMRFVPKYFIGKYNLHQRAYALQGFKVNSKYVFYSLFHKQNVIAQKAVQSTVLSLRLPILQNFEIEVPKSPDEQQKIAACLSSLDDVIEGHEEKLNALEEHKKGLMQNLFPQEREAMPKFRFSEFVNDGDWVEKKLGEVADFFKGKGISKSDIVEGGLISCIRYGELYTTYGETILNVKSKTNIDKSELFFSKKYDVIIPSSGETQIDIATASCVMLDNIALGGDLNVIRTEINGVFLSYLLNSSQRLEIAKMAQGNAVVHLYNYQLASLSIKYPSPSEQQKIGEVLSSVDELIVAQREKIDALKEHKKGLMQGLFPKIDS